MDTNLTLTLATPNLLVGATVVGMSGREAISRPYHFDIGVAVDDPDLLLDPLLGQRATLQIETLANPMKIHGVVRSAEQLYATDTRGLYRLSLVPALWRLSETRHSRVFVEQSVVDIVTGLLDAHGVTPDLTGLDSSNYSQLLHVCQYNESDLAFISRLLEREGIYFYFRQLDTEEQLVLGDGPSYEEPLGAAIPYSPGALITSCFTSFHCKHHTQPDMLELADRNYMHGAEDVLASWSLGGNVRVVRDFGDVSIRDAAGAQDFDLDRLLLMRVEELTARRVLFQASGSAFHLRAGYKFALEDHPRTVFNDNTYLAVSVDHYGHATNADSEFAALLGLRDEGYQIDVSAIHSGVQFRPERRTPVPRIDGVLSGTIDGPSDAVVAPVDKHGRYKVVIHFDERAHEAGIPAGGHSTWVRMLQPHGGSKEGFHAPLHKGTEVLLVFLGGDPDRPVIVGAVPTTKRPSLVTDSNANEHVLKTHAGNRITLDDTADAIKIDTYTPGNHVRVAMRDEKVTVGGEQYVEVGTDAELHVGADRVLETQGDLDVTVYGDARYEIKGREVDGKLVEQTGNLTQTVAGNLTQTVTGKIIRKCKDEEVTINENRVVSEFAGTVSESYAAAVNTNFVGLVNSNYLAGVNNNFIGVAVNVFGGGVNNNFLGLALNTFGGVAIGIYLLGQTDTFIGLSNSNFLGGAFDLYGALAGSIKLSGELNVHLGIALNFLFAGYFNLLVGASLTLWTPVMASIGAGLQVDLNEGYKVASTNGTIEADSVRIFT